MANIKLNIIIPKDNNAFNRLLIANPTLVNKYIVELSDINSGSYPFDIVKEDIPGIISKDNILGNKAEINNLLKSNFIGIN